MQKIIRKISVAPMMDCTDRHDRYFLRLMSFSLIIPKENGPKYESIGSDSKIAISNISFFISNIVFVY